MPAPADGVAAERRVHLGDAKTVKAADLGEGTAPLGDELGTDAVAGEKRDAVAPALGNGAHGATVSSMWSNGVICFLVSAVGSRGVRRRSAT
jgi:hypothetical protein